MRAPGNLKFYTSHRSAVETCIQYKQIHNSTPDVSTSRTTHERPYSSPGRVHITSLWPWYLTSDLENLFSSNSPIHAINICGKFYWNPPLSTEISHHAETFLDPAVTLTLTFDLWPLTLTMQCALTWWILVPSFVEISPLSRDNAKYVLTDVRTEGRTIRHRNACRRQLLETEA